MAMTAAGMAEAILAELTSVYPEMATITGSARTETLRYYQAISQAIIGYVAANAVILPGSFNVPGAWAVIGAGNIT